MSKIKFVYFDLGDVLFEWKDGLKGLSELSKKSYQETHDIFEKEKHDNDAILGKITPQELWQLLKKELDIDKDTEIDDFADWWSDHFKPILEMHDFVREVSKNYKVGILTNIYHEIIFHAFRKGHIPEVNYETIIQSCDLNLAKPDEALFKHAEKVAGVLASEILFIDNKAENIDKARSLGWQAILYDVNNPQKSVAEIKRILGLN
jgi:putative hydrolase of the HAD superfamily